MLSLAVDAVISTVGPPVALAGLAPVTGLMASAVGALTIVLASAHARSAMALTYTGVAVTAVAKTYAWLRITAGAGPVPIQALVVCGHLIAAVGVVRWLRVQGLARRQVVRPVLAVVVGVLAVGIACWWLGRQYMGVAHGDHLAVTVRLGIDSALLVWVTQVSTVVARQNRTFALLRLGLVLMIAADAILEYGSFTDSAVHPLHRTVAAAGFALFGAAALHPDVTRGAASSTDARAAAPYRFIEIATVCLSVAVAPALRPAPGEIQSVVRVLVAVGLFCAILYRSDRALRAVERREAEERHAATHDGLTGLPNRVGLYESFTSGADVSLLFVEIDNLKMVNDGHGRRVGDEMIAAAAQRITSLVGDRGAAFRYADDEFVISTGAGLEAARELARAVVDALGRPLDSSCGAITLSASVGIAHRADPADLDDLIQEADSAMYRAKADGGGRCAVFDDCMRSDALRELELAGALRQAVEQRSFELHYQPIVHTDTDRVVAFEALLRWRHQGALRSPADFMEMAESSGLIIEMGQWVLDSAVAVIADLWRADPTCRIAVSINVSARQLGDAGFADGVAAALAAHRVPSAALWIELTETALISDVDATTAVLRRVSDLGVRVCLDDFGVGYSALSHLSTFPIDVVKIDKSFVIPAARDHGPDGEKKRVVMAAIQSISSTLGLDTVAEGVEDAAVHGLVAEIGCTYSQGWFHGRPQPREVAFRTLLGDESSTAPSASG
ncbi:hypothetical protein GCM10023147_30490 [Tsukamurella soli]|uniref:Diguanylate cyclase (GGDEF) domain-containing protein n=2 Tax=Tsukamurella soli TaxID=644556 RepID=A0ABP8JUH4_9ACTN